MDNIFGARLKALRKSHNKTQQDVADRLHITRSAYTYYELGDSYPNLAMLDKLANYFGVSTDYLMGRTDEQVALAIEAPELAIPKSALESELLLEFRSLKTKQKKLLLQWLKTMKESENEEEEE